MEWFEDETGEWDLFESCPVVRDGCSALKYRYHPVGAAQELAEARCFRHLSMGALCGLVRDHGSTRQAAQWGKLAQIEVEIDETARNVGLFGGLSCLLCERLAWEPAETRDEPSWNTYSKLKDYDDIERFEALRRQQSSFWSSDPHAKYQLPPLCAECFAIADGAMGKDRNRHSWRHRDAVVLKGYLAVLQAQL